MGYYQDLILSKTATRTQINTATPLTQALVLDTGSANIVYLYGGKTATGDDLFIYANPTDDYPRIELFGTGSLRFTSTDYIQFYQSGVSIGRLYRSGAILILECTQSNDDLYLMTNGTGVLKFGTYTAGAAADSTGYITIKDAAGNSRKLMVQA